MHVHKENMNSRTVQSSLSVLLFALLRTSCDGFSVPKRQHVIRVSQLRMADQISLENLSITGEPFPEQDEDDVDEQDNIVTRLTNDRVRCIKGVASRTCPLNEEVARLASMSLKEANELIELGAVWARIETLSEEDALSQYEQFGLGTLSTSAQYADLPRGWGENEFADDDDEQDLDRYIEKMKNQRYRRILSPVLIEAGTDIRVYPNPRRFPACYELTRERLLYEDTTFIVVDKPPMLPSQPDTSNYFECCPGCVQELMGPFTTIDNMPVPRPLLCHRVDSVVGGCVVMSKDTNGQRVFSELQRQRKIKKVYLAVTTNPVPTGLHVHWMWAPQSARGKSGGPPCQVISHTAPETRRKAKEFWIRCVLEVVSTRPIQVAEGAEGYDPGDVQHYESTIRLVTGRKHQVRAQLASLGAPIIRDTLYAPMEGITLDKLINEEGDLDTAIADCRVPLVPIGLQAHAILFGGIRAKAKTPWWGDGTGKS